MVDTETEKGPKMRGRFIFLRANGPTYALCRNDLVCNADITGYQFDGDVEPNKDPCGVSQEGTALFCNGKDINWQFSSDVSTG